jgi:hypothetical protein
LSHRFSITGQKRRDRRRRSHRCASYPRFGR